MTTATRPRRGVIPTGWRATWARLIELGERALATRVGTAVVRALSVVTGIGWTVLVAVAIAAVLVWQAGWVEAGVVMLMGLITFVIGVASILGRAWYTAEISLPVDRVRVGQVAMGEIRVSNPLHRTAASGTIELPVGTFTAQFLVPRLGPEQTWNEVFAVQTRRRGVVNLGPAQSVRADPLGMVKAVQRWAEPVRLLVHPLTVRVPFSAVGFQADVEGVTTARLSSSDVSFHALRDYSPGDDRRYVHWPTTARVGSLTVRQFEETRRSHHVILLDTRQSSWMIDDFELAVSVAASLAVAGIGRGGRVSVATSTGWLPSKTAMRVMDEFTELELSPTTLSLTDRVRQAIAQRVDASVLTVICAGSTTDTELARWAALAGPDLDTGVVRVRPGASPARLTCGRARVADCPELSDLPRLMYRGG